MMPRFVLCQDCLRVLPYSDALHQTDGSCVCGGDMCGCAECNSIAERLVRSDFVFEAWEFQHNLNFTGYTVAGGLRLSKVVNHS